MTKAKKYQLKLFAGASLVVGLRPYRTAKTERAISGKGQLIVPTYLFLTSVKEISFSLRDLPSRQPNPGMSLFPFLMIFIGFSGVVYFSAQNAKTIDRIEPTATFSVPTPALASKSEKPDLHRSAPKHIKIAKADVNVPIEPVGQKADKTMEVPPLFKNVAGWYKPGPSPGEIGPAVIVGHVDTYKGPSVFYHLKDLKAGDLIEISRADKTKIKFKVTGLKQFSQSDFPTKEVYGNIDHAGLRLITCGGTFNEQTLSYSANTVVFATMVKK